MIIFPIYSIHFEFAAYNYRLCSEHNFYLDPNYSTKRTSDKILMDCKIMISYVIIYLKRVLE